MEANLDNERFFLELVETGRLKVTVEAAGSGCLDVAVFALRLAVILFHVERPIRFIALDEPFRYVSQNYRPNLVGLVRELSQHYHVQFFIISHDQDLIRLSENPVLL